MSSDNPDYKAGYRKGHFDASLTAAQERQREQAREDQAKKDAEQGIVRTPNGVYRPSDDSGVMITVTQPTDPAYKLLQDGHATTPKVYKRGCYICEDPEFAQMGLPLCRKCPKCGGHIAADDTTCDDCGHDEMDDIP